MRNKYFLSDICFISHFFTWNIDHEVLHNLKKKQLTKLKRTTKINRIMTNQGNTE